mmetsp:Transcript_66469/g.191049  ORF Transcript_66469/g.191049 Transcript_66469/m.191049 type:complete len:212 (-) Transcript_66469:1489-2124(-)
MGMALEEKKGWSVKGRIPDLHGAVGRCGCQQAPAIGAQEGDELANPILVSHQASHGMTAHLRVPYEDGSICATRCKQRLFFRGREALQGGHPMPVSLQGPQCHAPSLRIPDSQRAVCGTRDDPRGTAAGRGIRGEGHDHPVVTGERVRLNELVSLNNPHFHRTIRQTAGEKSGAVRCGEGGEGPDPICMRCQHRDGVALGLRIPNAHSAIG